MEDHSVENLAIHASIADTFASRGMATLHPDALVAILHKISPEFFQSSKQAEILVNGYLSERGRSSCASNSKTRVDVNRFCQWLASDARSSGSKHFVVETAEDVVERLAHRSFTLRSLLHFMRHTLPSAMPHCDLKRTRTVDIVWQIVVPQTALQGCAYVDIMEPGRSKRLPDKMVSHHWGNLFAHLVAAIFADALGRETFWEIDALLDDPKGLDFLEAELSDAGVLDSTRWLCIFCVNQHISICNQPWNGCDSITGQAYSPCGCQREKLHSGDGCEMNKFDDMINVFKQRLPHYQHLAAADFGLELLTRIWVIAELAEVFRQQLPCSFLASRPDIALVESQTQQIDVRSAKASRPEDVDMILAKIENKDSFNSLAKFGVLRMYYISASQALVDSLQAMLKFQTGLHYDSRQALEGAIMCFRDVKEELKAAQSLEAVVAAWDKRPKDSDVKGNRFACGWIGRAEEQAEVIRRMKSASQDRIWELRRFHANDRKNEEELSLEDMVANCRLQPEGQSIVEVNGPATAMAMVRSRTRYLTALVACIPRHENGKQEVDNEHDHSTFGKGSTGKILRDVLERLQFMSSHWSRGRSNSEEGLSEPPEDFFDGYDVLRYDMGGGGVFRASVLPILYFDDKESAEARLVLYRDLCNAEAGIAFRGEWNEVQLFQFLVKECAPSVGLLSEVSRAWFCLRATEGLLALWLGSDGGALAQGFIDEQTQRIISVLQEAAADIPAGFPCCVLHPSSLSSLALKRFIGPEGASGDVMTYLSPASWSECSAFQSQVKPALMLFRGCLSTLGDSFKEMLKTSGGRTKVREWDRVPGSEAATQAGSCVRFSLPIDVGNPPAPTDVVDFCRAAAAGSLEADAFKAGQTLLADVMLLPILHAAP